jgi:hypothetical protein
VIHLGARRRERVTGYIQANAEATGRRSKAGSMVMEIEVDCG